MLGLGIGINKKTVAGGIAPVLEPFGTPAAAYSLRYIYPTIYSGNVVLVRRSSDNAEQGFTPEEITDGTLTTFTGAGDGFVKTWYDQSGNSRNATQTISAQQPKIVNSGSLNTLNGKPALLLVSTSNNWLDVSASGNWQFFMTVINNTDSPNFSSFEAIVSGDSSAASDSGLQAEGATKNFYTSSTWYNTVYLNGVLKGFANILPTINNQSLVTAYHTSSVGTKTLRFFVDRNFIGSRHWSGNVQEILIYDSNKATDRAAIESNIAAYYGITLV